MMNVLICEDDVFFMNMYRLAVKRYARKNPNQNVHLVLTTSNPNLLLKKLPSLPQVNTVFLLDIGFSDSLDKGISMAKQVTDLLPDAVIIFITSHNDLAIKSIESRVQPFDFIRKDIGLANIQETLFRDLSEIFEKDSHKQSTEQAVFEFNAGPRHFRMPTVEINYLKASDNPHHVILAGISNYVEFIGTLKNYQEQVPNFLAISRSLIVNTENVRELDFQNRTITFNDQSTLVVPQKALKILATTK